MQAPTQAIRLVACTRMLPASGSACVAFALSIAPIGWIAWTARYVTMAKARRNAEVEQSGVEYCARPRLRANGRHHLTVISQQPPRRDDLGHFDLPTPTGLLSVPQSLAFATRNDEKRRDRPGLGPD